MFHSTLDVAVKWNLPELELSVRLYSNLVEGKTRNQTSVYPFLLWDVNGYTEVRNPIRENDTFLCKKIFSLADVWGTTAPKLLIRMTSNFCHMLHESQGWLWQEKIWSNIHRLLFIRNLVLLRNKIKFY